MRQQNWKPDPNKGYMVSGTGKPANAISANAVLINRDIDKDSEDRKFYLYVTDISNGWQLMGQKSQAAQSTVFYPMNVQQNDLVIKGICPSQHEYDRLVNFIKTHHNTVQDPGGDKLHRVDFKFMPQKQANDRRLFPPMFVGGQILSIRAGHERHQFYPRFEFAMKVVEDVLDQQERQSINVNVLEGNYLSTFGGNNGERFYHQNVQSQFTDLAHSIGSTVDSIQNVIEGVGNAADVISDAVGDIPFWGNPHSDDYDQSYWLGYM